MDTPAFAFAAPVLRLPDGMTFHYLPLPHDIADAYLALGIRRVIATLNGQSFRRAIQGRRDGERHLVIGTDILRAIGATYGDTVTVELIADPSPDAIDLGEEFAAVLEEDREAAERFYAFPPGRQRSLAYYVTSAKRPETRRQRAYELAHKIKTNTLYGDRKGPHESS